jgi:hypothetical protein
VISTPTLTPANGATATAQALTATAQATLAGPSTPTLTPANGATATAQALAATAQATLAGPSTPTLTPANAASATAQAVAATAQSTVAAGQTVNRAGADGGADANGTPGAAGSTDPANGTSGGDAGGGPGSSGGGAGGPAGAAGGSGPSSRIARIDLSQNIDDRGLVHQEVRAADKSNAVQVLIPINTTALTSDKRPVQAIDVNTLGNHPVTADNQFVIGSALDLQPSGATFSPPITIGISYDPSKLTNGLTDGDLAIGYFDTAQGKWMMLDSTVDAQSHVVIAKTSHFTTFAVLNKPPASINWWLLFAFLMVDAAGAVVAYLYLARRRRLAAAAEADQEDEDPFGEDDADEDWLYRRRTADAGWRSPAITALLTAPSRRGETVVEGEFEEEGVNGAGPSVNGVGDHTHTWAAEDDDDDNRPAGKGHAETGH